MSCIPPSIPPTGGKAVFSLLRETVFSLLRGAVFSPLEGGARGGYERAAVWPVLLLLLLIVGCSPAAPVVSQAIATVPTLTATPTRPPTFTPSPTSMPPSTHTPHYYALQGTPTETMTPLPTSTATPSPSPTPTATPCAETAGRMVTGTFPSPIQGFEQRYRIYLPPCYGQSDRLYPALYLFHGNIYTESHWNDLGVDEAADAGIVAGTLPPFLIVLPFDGEIANNTSGGDWSFEGVVLNELIPFIEDHYCVWPEAAGRAIGGISRGGYWSLEIGFRHPELFAAVGGHSAALFPEGAGPTFNPLSTGTDPRLIGLPIYLDIGDGDWLRQGVFDLHASMNAAGIPHVWNLNSGAHGDAYWQEHVAEYLAWYASHWPADESDYPSRIP